MLSEKQIRYASQFVGQPLNAVFFLKI